MDYYKRTIKRDTFIIYHFWSITIKKIMHIQVIILNLYCYQFLVSIYRFTTPSVQAYIVHLVLFYVFVINQMLKWPMVILCLKCLYQCLACLWSLLPVIQAPWRILQTFNLCPDTSASVLIRITKGHITSLEWPKVSPVSCYSIAPATKLNDQTSLCLTKEVLTLLSDYLYSNLLLKN